MLLPFATYNKYEFKKQLPVAGRTARRKQADYKESATDVFLIPQNLKESSTMWNSWLEKGHVTLQRSSTCTGAETCCEGKTSMLSNVGRKTLD